MNCFVVISSLTWWIVVLVDAGSLRYCIPKKIINSSSGLNSSCAILYQTQHEIQCVTAADRITCFKLLSAGKVDFMVAEPEDLRVMYSYSESNAVVTHQLKQFPEFQPQRDVEMIAIVKSDSDSALTTKGKKLCYLGLETSYIPQFDYYYTPYFESWLFSRDCDSHKSLLENRIASLSEHFEAACIAGPWSLDRTLDAELKAKYKNLCALCSNPFTCLEVDRYYGMNGALTCLRQGAGDIAWLNRWDAWKYFSQLASYGYSLLCPDGTTSSLTASNANESCTWIMDPRPVIVAHKSIANIVLDKVTDKGEEGSKFYQVIHTSYKFSYLQKLKKAENILDYLKSFPGYFSATVKAQTTCRPTRDVRWCVSSNLEAKKCRYLQLAATALNLNPNFTCVSLTNRDDCIRAVSTGKCDVFVAKISDEYDPKKLGVKSIIEMMGNKGDDSNIVAAIVRKKSLFNNYADLKGAKACFTGYRSIGWNAFYWLLETETDHKDPNDIEVISNFFKESCVLDLDEKNLEFSKNLTSLCDHNETTLGPEEKTFKCLMDGADVAFVNVSAARAYSSRNTVFNTEYKLICSSVERSSCFLAKVSLGSIIVHENLTKVREDDIYQLFLELDRYFGRTFDRETPMFQMYESYEEHSNVIFPEATMKLQRSVPGVQYGRYVDGLHSLKNSLTGNHKNSAGVLQTTFGIFVFAVFNALCSHYIFRILF